MRWVAGQSHPNDNRFGRYRTELSTSCGELLEAMPPRLALITFCPNFA